MSRKALWLSALIGFAGLAAFGGWVAGGGGCRPDTFSDGVSSTLPSSVEPPPADTASHVVGEWF